MDLIERSLTSEERATSLAILGPTPLTYQQLRSRVDHTAAILAQAGVARGTAVAISLAHSVENIVCILANWKLGAATVPINYRATASERDFILANAEAAFLICPAGKQAEAFELTYAVSEAVSLFRSAHAPRGQLGDEIALVIHTSGSTNRPKGVLLTKGALTANTLGVAKALKLTQDDSCALLTPPSFAYAFSQIFTHIAVGGRLMPWPMGLLDIGALLKAIDQNKITGIQANPTMFEMLLTVEATDWPGMKAVRYLLSGGQPLFSRLIQRLEAVLPNANFMNMYGLTENAPRVTMGWLPRPISDADKPWHVGMPIDGTKVEIERTDPSASEGEIVVSGTSLMHGYLHDTETNVRAFKTRDAGRIDEDGNLHLLGRLDNVFSVGHEKVSPEEIESLISNVEGVDDVAVSAAPHGLLGSMPVLMFKTSADPGEVSARIRRECTAKLSRAKVPHVITSVPDLPKTPYGKLDRRALRALAQTLVPQSES